MYRSTVSVVVSSCRVSYVCVCATIILFDFHLDGPEWLRHKLSSFDLTFTHESQCRKLAWPITQYGIERFEATETFLEAHRLEASKGGTNAQIDLLTCEYGITQVRIRRCQCAHRIVNVSRYECREVCPHDIYIWLRFATYIDHLISDRLTLAITVEPEDQQITHAG